MEFPEFPLRTSGPRIEAIENNGRLRRRPIPRKGHRKSRRGCLNCKRRKVKCQETLPECGHCKRNGLICRYPESAAIITPGSPMGSLQSTPTLFSMEDLRFYHHFLFNAVPPLPMRGEAIWRDMAQISHSFDFLVHAMLGLGASHLTASAGSNAPASQAAAALAHRVSAIKSLNAALSLPCASHAEGDARFAAMLALVFQSSYMPEGMLDFLCMTRGCRVVAETAMPNFGNSRFAGFSHEGHVATLYKLRAAAGEGPEQPWDADLVDAFGASLRGLALLCSNAIELRFLAKMQRALLLARQSAVDAFVETSSMYWWLGGVPQESFSAFVNADNLCAQLLMIHFVLVEVALGQVALDAELRPYFCRKRMTALWLARLVEKLPADYEKYARWPLNYIRALELSNSSPGS